MKKFLALFLLLISFSLPAYGHSTLVSATPEVNSTIDYLPKTISLTFNEPLLVVGDKNPNKVEVQTIVGTVLSGKASIDGSTISVPVNIENNGDFKVSYRVVSADGHVIEGSHLLKVEAEEANGRPVFSDIQEVETESGPNLLVRSVMTLLAGAAFLALLRIKKRKS